MPKLMRFWDFKENKKHGLDPNLVSAYSPLPANWHCKKCDYRWPATIRSRARTPDACPFCDSHNVIIPGKNDVLTLLPDFANFYDFDITKQMELIFVNAVLLLPSQYIIGAKIAITNGMVQSPAESAQIY